MKKNNIYFTSFLILFSTVLTMNAQVINDNLIEDYRWENRLLLVFAPSIHDGTFDKLYKAIQDSRDKIVDRDLKIMYLIDKGQSSIDGENINRETASAIRKKYVVTDIDVTLVLIGKDGGEKLRQRNTFNLNEFFRRIDQMPMRKAEMEERNENND